MQSTPSINMQELTVTVWSVETIIYQGQAKAITSVNEKGMFDLLPLHSNFVTLINQTLIIHEINGTKKPIAIDHGVLEIYENKVFIFLGFGEEESI
jgi:F0F1-type ATP synthase epsilon subunit